MYWLFFSSQNQNFGAYPCYNQALPLPSWGWDSYFWACLIGPPQMASCGFQISPRTNVVQLGHCSSDELTGLTMIICPLKSSRIALVAPLPSHRLWDPFRGKTAKRAVRCHWKSFYSKSKRVTNTSKALFKMGCCLLLHCFSEICLRKVFS